MHAAAAAATATNVADVDIARRGRGRDARILRWRGICVKMKHPLRPDPDPGFDLCDRFVWLVDDAIAIGGAMIWREELLRVEVG